jgi:hypothetical protein
MLRRWIVSATTAAVFSRRQFLERGQLQGLVVHGARALRQPASHHDFGPANWSYWTNKSRPQGSANCFLAAKQVAGGAGHVRARLLYSRLPQIFMLFELRVLRKRNGCGHKQIGYESGLSLVRICCFSRALCDSVRDG